MNLKHYPEEKLKEEILEIVGKYVDLNTHKVFVFGSRVTEKGDDRSDIDVGIEGTNEVKHISIIKEDVDNLPLLYKIDVVDFKTVSSDFYKVAKEKVEYLN